MLKKHPAISTTVFLFGLSATTLLGKDRVELSARVLFPFLVENTMLPAGEYIVSRMDPEDSSLIIRNEDTGKSIEFLTESIQTKNLQPVKSAFLMLDVVSGDHFLSEVWTTGRRVAWRLVPSRMEKQETKTVINPIRLSDCFLVNPRNEGWISALCRSDDGLHSDWRPAEKGGIWRAFMGRCIGATGIRCRG